MAKTQLTPKERLKIVRRHLKDRVPLKDLCAEYNVTKNSIWGWERRLFEEGYWALGSENFDTKSQAQIERINYLHNQLSQWADVARTSIKEQLKLLLQLFEPAQTRRTADEKRAIIGFIEKWARHPSNPRGSVSIDELLEIAEVPRSTFYHWMKSIPEKGNLARWVDPDRIPVYRPAPYPSGALPVEGEDATPPRLSYTLVEEWRPEESEDDS